MVTMHGKNMFDVKWRRVARRRLGRLVGKMIGQWMERDAMDNCNWETIRKGVSEEEINDEPERKLDAQCKLTTKPIRKLAQKAKAWSEKFNAQCGAGNYGDKKGFRERSWNRIRFIRKDMYCNIGCATK